MFGDEAFRELTYLDTDDDDTADANNETVSDTGLIVGFSVIAVSFFLVAVMTIRINAKCQAFYEWNAIRLIMPAVSLFLCVENATLAVDSGKPALSTQWAIAVYMMQATVAPGIFIFAFVLTFLAYRTRAMPFCFVYRGPGRQATGDSWQHDDDEEVIQPLVRPAVLVVAVRLLALGLLILNLIVNFDVIWSDDDLAGRTGWATVVQNPSTSAIDHVILALLPMAIVCICCLYFSGLMWRYGCEFSLVIYPSIINPWLWPLFGTLAMMVGQCFGPDLYLVLSNAGVLCYMLAMLRVLSEVRHDTQQVGDLGHFLSALGNDTVTRTVAGLDKSDAKTSSSATNPGDAGSRILSSSIPDDQLSVESPPIPVASFSEPTSAVAATSEATSSSFIRLTSSSTRTTRISNMGTNVESFSGNKSGVLNAVTRMPRPIPDAESSDANEAAITSSDDPTSAVLQVQGITKRPEKLRRGQRPKGKYVVQ